MTIRFRKKPLEVEAVRWSGQMHCFPEHWFPRPRVWGVKQVDGGEMRGMLSTNSGEAEIKEGDYLVRGIKGEFYPVPGDIFAASYDAVEEAAAA